MRLPGLVVLVSCFAACGRSGAEYVRLNTHDDNACIAAIEICNGADDDCDGDIDEGCDAACTAAAGFSDSFDDGVMGDGWYTSTYGNGFTLDESGGELVLGPSTTSSASGAAYVSRQTYDLHDSAVRVEVTQMIAQVTYAWADMQLIDGNDSRLRISQQDGDLNASYRVSGGSEIIVGSVPYDPVATRHWSIRASGATVTWEASADGTTWAPIATFAPGFALSFLRIQLQAGNSVASASLGTAHFDNLNAAATSAAIGSATVCPIIIATDDFAASERSGLWYDATSSGGASATQAGGQLTFTLPAASVGDVSYKSGSVYDAREGVAWMHVGALLNPDASVAGGLVLADDATHELALTQSGGQLRCSSQGTSFGEVAYDASSMQYVRIAESAGAVSCGFSADGVAWTSFASASDPIDMSAVSIILRGEETAAVASPGTMRVLGFGEP